MPQLNAEFYASQLFWLFLCFAFLLFFLWKISLPRISEILEKRENKIIQDIDTAKKFQAEAEAIQKNIDQQIQNSINETDDMIKKNILNIRDRARREFHKIEKKILEKIDESSALIEKNKKQSIKEIDNQLLEITKLTLSKLSSISVKEKDIEDAVIKAKERFIN